tara:strand:- start:201 stop:365 length:165 start_codon:yes stop_codon:yes gene_type:complete
MNGTTDEDWNVISEEEEDFDDFYLYFGILRTVLKKVSTEFYEGIHQSFYEERDI